jgi:DNA-directed RNA polymerase specialized sigma24 family protein
MNHLPVHLNAIDPLLRSLARNDPDFYDELRQTVALAMLERFQKGQPLDRPISTGIARHSACDMISERKRRRQRFVSFTDVLSRSGEGRSANDGHRAVDPEQVDLTFDTVWMSLSCERFKSLVKRWRNSLRPKERRALRGLRRGRTQAEMAVREEVAPGTVAAWVHRSRQKLEALLS